MVVTLARILYVDDVEFWRDFVVRRLQDHHVDVVGSLSAAITLLDSEAPYTVVLVDLNLENDRDLQGGELLDLLSRRYPKTKRIVVTGSPPAGSIRKHVFERYDVHELIIKKDMELPDLIRAVEEAITNGDDDLPQSLRLNRSAVRQRFRDWQRAQSDRLRATRREAEAHLEDATKVSTQTRQRAQMAVNEAREREVQFRAVCKELRKTLANISTERELSLAVEALDDAEEQFGDDPLADDS
jgi:CheY-like chemotaxis protein